MPTHVIEFPVCHLLFQDFFVKLKGKKQANWVNSHPGANYAFLVSVLRKKRNWNCLIEVCWEERYGKLILYYNTPYCDYVSGALLGKQSKQPPRLQQNHDEEHKGCVKTPRICKEQFIIDI